MLPGVVANLVPVAVAIAVAGTALAGCGGSSSDDPPPATTVAGPRRLDTAKVERAIAESIRTQRKTSATVSCPKGVRQSKDVNFVCRVRSKFGITEFAVIQTDDAGHVSYAAAETP